MFWWYVLRLKSKNWDRRGQAATRLGTLGDGRAVPYLIAALPRGPHVNIIEALGKIGATGAVEPLISMLLEGRSGPVQIAAARALGKLADRRAVQPLISRLESSHPDVRRAAVSALTLLDWKPANGLQRALSAIALHDWKAAAQMGTAATPPLLQVFSEKAWKDYRRHIAEALGAIADERCVEPLAAALGDKDPNVSRVAAESLVSIGPPACTALIARLEEEDQQEVIVEILVRIRDSRAIEPLAKLFLVQACKKTSEELRIFLKKIEKSFVRLGDFPAAYYASCLEDENSKVRWVSIQLLDAFDWQPANDRERVFHAVAHGRWNEAAEFGAIAVEPLLREVPHSPKKLGEEVIAALASIGDPSAIRGLAVALAYHPDIATSALSHLNSDWSRSEPARAAIPCLLDIVAHEKRLYTRASPVAMNAMRALAKIPDPRAFDALLRLTQDRKLAKEAALALTVLLQNAASEFDSDLLDAARCLDGIIQETWEDFSISEGSYDSAGAIRHDHPVDCTYLKRLAETELRRRHS